MPINRGLHFVKTFEDLVLEFVISIADRRKYNSLMNGILIDWFYDTKTVRVKIFDNIMAKLPGFH